MRKDGQHHYHQEMQIKYPQHLIPIRMATMKNNRKKRIGNHVVKLEPFCTTDSIKQCSCYVKQNSVFLSTLKTELLYDTATPLLGTYPLLKGVLKRYLHVSQQHHYDLGQGEKAGSTPCSISQPSEHDPSENQESDTSQTEPPRHPYHSKLFTTVKRGKQSKYPLEVNE